MRDHHAPDDPRLLQTASALMRTKAGVYAPMRASVFCRKLSLGAAAGSASGAAAPSEGSGVLAVGMDFAMAKKS